MPVASSTVSRSTARVCASYSAKFAQCVVDEVAVHHGAGRRVVGLEQQPAQPGEQRHVAAEADLDELVGDRDAVADHAVHLLRILEPDQPGLRQRVDRNDLGAVGLRLLQHRQHPRMVGAGVLAGDDDQVGVATSSTVTEPLPMPMESISAVPEDSWHMLEQSGRLLVPKLRTRSW